MSAEQETQLALRNAVKLGGALFCTVLVTLAVRIWLPRHFGPEFFGRLHFAQMLAGMVVGLTAFGIESYIGREVATRPKHASDFFGTIVVFRLMATIALAAVMAAILWSDDQRTSLDWQLAFVFAGWQFLFIINGSFAALLNARGTVNHLSIINMASKAIWGGGIAALLLLDAALVWVPPAFLLAEAFKCAALSLICRRHLGLRFRFDRHAGLAVVITSIPFFLNGLSHRIYSKVDVYMIGRFLSDHEVGFYGVSQNLTGLMSLLLPVVSAVVLPMSARIAREHGNERMFEVMRNTLRLSVSLSLMIYVLLAVNAPEVVALVFGEAYAAAHLSLLLLGAAFPLTYFCTITASHLITAGRAWTVTTISLVGLALNPLANSMLIPYFHDALGDGGGAAGAAFTSLLTELVASVAFIVVLRSKVIDSRMLRLPFQLIAMCGAVLAVHSLVPLHWLGRVPLEVLVYLAVGGGVGALPAKALITAIRNRLRPDSNQDTKA